MLDYEEMEIRENYARWAKFTKHISEIYKIACVWADTYFMCKKVDNCSLGINPFVKE